MKLTKSAATLLSLWTAVASLSLLEEAAADEGLGGFGRIDEPETKTADPWGPVPTEKKSIANLAPGLLPYFNNGPVFGLPGTVVGSFWDSTQVAGDWGGERTKLARNGIFFDAYSTSTYQNVMSGGLKTGDAFVQNTQISLNVDTGRAGLWAGGLFHFTVQSRSGDGVDNTFTVGSFVPQYTGLVLPDPLFAHHTYPSEYFLVQALSDKFSVVLGKISDVFIPDQTLFGNSYKYYFANFNFNKNPMTTNHYHPTALAALGVWVPTKELAIGAGVLDPNTKASNFASNAFDHVNLYVTAIASYQLGGLPGQFSPSFNWTNQPKINLGSPFGSLSLGQIPEALGALLGGPLPPDLPTNFMNESWFAIANISQYLYVMDDAATIEKKLKSGQVINGIGVFARVGYAPADTSPITRDASIALFAHGLCACRPYDSFGAGFYYDGFGSPLKNSIARLTANTVSVGNERGIEVFYDFAITPAVRLIPSYQHIWNPIIAQVEKGQNSADVFLGRLNVAW
jgi:porin